MRRICIALALAAAGISQAATVTVYTTLAGWEAAISGSAQLQDFSADAVGTDLTGVPVLPGVTLSSNMGAVRVFGAEHSANAFSPARLAGNAFYEATYALPFLATAFDITGFEADPANPSTAQDSGLLSFLFSDGSTRDLSVSGGDGSPVFIGIIADSAITSFRWNEAHEAGAVNEETGLDNLRVAMRATATPLPLPGTLPLVALALAAVPFARRRRG